MHSRLNTGSRLATRLLMSALPWRILPLKRSRHHQITTSRNRHTIEDPRTLCSLTSSSNPMPIRHMHPMPADISSSPSRSSHRILREAKCLSPWYSSNSSNSSSMPACHLRLPPKYRGRQRNMRSTHLRLHPCRDFLLKAALSYLTFSVALERLRRRPSSGLFSGTSRGYLTWLRTKRFRALFRISSRSVLSTKGLTWPSRRHDQRVHEKLSLSRRSRPSAPREVVVDQGEIAALTAWCLLPQTNPHTLHAATLLVPQLAPLSRPTIDLEAEATLSSSLQLQQALWMTKTIPRNLNLAPVE